MEDNSYAKNEQTFKADLKVTIEKRIHQFPFYFYFNIIINIFLVLLLIGAAAFVVMDFSSGLGYGVYGLLFMVFLMGVFPITLRGFFRNVHIFHALRTGNYKIEIEDYEMDHAVDFIEHLPKSKEEVEEIKIALTFGRIIEMLELLDIVYCENNVYKLDPLIQLQRSTAIAADEEEIKIATAKK